MLVLCEFPAGSFFLEEDAPSSRLAASAVRLRAALLSRSAGCPQPQVNTTIGQRQIGLDSTALRAFTGLKATW
jgi:hypothetical protein